MDLLGKILQVLDAKMETPVMYGAFHLTFFALSVLVGVALCFLQKGDQEKFARKLFFITGILVLLLEIYKQINYTFRYDGVKFYADYQWYAFPFQFCSTPMYVSILAAFVKNRKVYDALCAYLASFSLFAGLVVMLYPPQVFISTIGINIQTMIAHGTMIAVGIYLLGSGYVKAESKNVLKAIYVFSLCVLTASIMNEIAYFTGLLKSETFNMFYISPHCEPSLPVYSIVQQYVPYPWCALIYIAVFSLAAYVVVLFAKLIKKACFAIGKK